MITNADCDVGGGCSSLQGLCRIFESRMMSTPYGLLIISPNINAVQDLKRGHRLYLELRGTTSYIYSRSQRGTVDSEHVHQHDNVTRGHLRVSGGDA